jgi:hypothetical protein
MRQFADDRKPDCRLPTSGRISTEAISQNRVERSRAHRARSAGDLCGGREVVSNAPQPGAAQDRLISRASIRKAEHLLFRGMPRADSAEVHWRVLESAAAHSSDGAAKNIQRVPVGPNATPRGTNWVPSPPIRPDRPDLQRDPSGFATIPSSPPACRRAGTLGRPWGALCALLTALQAGCSFARRWPA